MEGCISAQEVRDMPLPLNPIKRQQVLGNIVTSLGLMPVGYGIRPLFRTRRGTARFVERFQEKHARAQEMVTGLRRIEEGDRSE